MKRLMMVVLAFAVMLPAWVMATGEAETAAPEGPLTVTALAPFSGTNKPEVYPYWAELANEKFNLEIDFERTSRDGIDEKINLRFAAGDYFDWLDATNANPPESAIKRWGLEGHLVALDDQLDNLPNYVALWSDQPPVKLIVPRTPGDLELALAHARAADGKLYYLPVVSQELIPFGWMYRKDAFDAHGLEWPSTPDGLFDALMTLKRANPESWPYVNRNGLGWFLSPYYKGWRVGQAPGRSGPGVHVDIDSGELVYPAGTDKFRGMMTFINKMVANGLVHPEWATIDWAGYQDLVHKQLLSYIEGNSAAAGAVFWNEQSKLFDPDSDVNWVGAERYIAAYPERGELVHRLLPAYAKGPFITVGASDEKLQRLIRFFDWMATPEGEQANLFGREGESFEYRDGKPHYLSHVSYPKNPEGDVTRYHYGLQPLLLFSDWWVRHHRGDEVDIGFEFSEAQMGKDWVKPIAWQFTPDERQDLADIEVTVNDVYEAYAARFMNGELDPADDADWGKYMSELEKARLNRMMDQYQQVWERMGMPR